MTDKKYNELLNKYGAKELSKALVFSVKLTRAQEKEDNALLRAAIKKHTLALTPQQKVKVRLLQLRFEMEDYLKGSHFDKHKTFSYFLKSYISSLEKKQNEFAREISIPATVLSQYANSYRKPTEEVIVRLELHSNGVISAVSWFQLLQKEELHNLNANKTLRAKQKQFVRRESGLAA